MKILTAILALAAVLAPGAQASAPRICVDRETSFTGRGNTAEPLLGISIGSDVPCRVGAIGIVLTAEDGDIDAISIVRDGRTLCRKKVRDGKASYSLRPRTTVMHTGTLQICADISSSATEGHKVGCDVESVKAGGRSIVPSRPAPGSREILLCRKRLYAPGDYGSKAWRIPAILQLKDGTLLAVNDKRNKSEEDLPGEIDIVARRSKDGGRTWDEPTYVVRSSDFMTGRGDPSLGQFPDGTVICMFCGGETFGRSSAQNPQRSFFALSHDSGLTWDEPVELTSKIWGTDSSFPQTAGYSGNFFSSGTELMLESGPHKGRLLVAGVLYDKNRGNLVNHAFYTDDGGQTWHASELACPTGDEAKMVQLNDGRILMSIRTTGDRLWTVSEDDGVTWGPVGGWPEMHVTACNGDLISYGDSLLLHSVPYSMKREDISVLVSRDQGRTWSMGRNIFPGPGQYSSLTVLQDGTIGAYIEKNTWGTELWYENFSLEWLLAGESVTESAACRVTGVRLWKDGPIWAECNIGAATPDASGSFFAWGETSPKNVFGWGTYRYGHSDSSVAPYGSAVLAEADDAAAAMLHDGWTIPTVEDFLALRERCTWTWVVTDHGKGYEVKGECGSIFLPATGYWSGNRLRYPGDCGFYWTADSRPDNPAQASEYYFNSQFPGDAFGRGRDCGHVIRAIKK